MSAEKRKRRNRLWAGRIVRAWLYRRFVCRATVISVTGSCGKTGTVSFLGKILSDVQPCLIGVDANAYRGVVRSLMTMKSSYRFYVQENGTTGPGKLAQMMVLLKPHIGIVTTVGLDHYKSFRGLENTAQEKDAVVASLPRGGVAVLNADDPHVLAMANRTRARVLTYGRSEGADVRASGIRAAWPERLSFDLTYQGESCHLETRLFGDLAVTSVLAAIAGGIAAGVDLGVCVESLQGVEAYGRRMSLHHTGNGIWFVNDTFKAPFWSVPKVLAQMEGASAPRKTVFFGSFSDTPGSDSPKYRAMAREALCIVDRVIFVGKKADFIRKMFSPETEGRLFVFDAPEEACRFLSKIALKDELVLIKSNSLEHLERLIDGQAKTIRCWKGSCTKQVRCSQCEESGLIVPAEV